MRAEEVRRQELRKDLEAMRKFGRGWRRERESEKREEWRRSMGLEERVPWGNLGDDGAAGGGGVGAGSAVGNELGKKWTPEETQDIFEEVMSFDPAKWKKW